MKNFTKINSLEITNVNKKSRVPITDPCGTPYSFKLSTELTLKQIDNEKTNNKTEAIYWLHHIFHRFSFLHNMA